MDETICTLKEEIARLQEQVKASDKALSLAEKLTAAATVAAKAAANSNWSALISLVAIAISLWAAFHGRTP